MTRFGGVAAEMENFVDRAGAVALHIFSSTGGQHGGWASIILATYTIHLHFGMAIAGLPHRFSGQTQADDMSPNRRMPWPSRRRRKQPRA